MRPAVAIIISMLADSMALSDGLEPVSRTAHSSQMVDAASRPEGPLSPDEAFILAKAHVARVSSIFMAHCHAEAMRFSRDGLSHFDMPRMRVSTLTGCYEARAYFALIAFAAVGMQAATLC